MINQKIQNHLCALDRLGRAFYSTGNECVGKTISSAVASISEILTKEDEARRKAEVEKALAMMKQQNESMIAVANKVAGRELLKRGTVKETK